jgi:hypothetical protein
MKLLVSALTIVAFAYFRSIARAEHVTLSDGTPLQLRFIVHPLQAAVSAEQLESQATAGATIPLWSATVKSLGKSYRYTMVGQNPQVKLSKPETVIPFIVVPVKFIFANGDVFDPAAPDPTCSPAGTPLRLVLESSILKNIVFYIGQQKVTTGQYSDVFQFANFFKFTGPGGINPDFSFTLKPKVLAPLSIFLPAKAGIVERARCGNLGLISSTDWIDLVETSIFEHLKSSLKPTTIPFFLFYNVMMCDAAGCGILGFHDAFRNPSYLRRRRVRHDRAVGFVRPTFRISVTKSTSCRTIRSVPTRPHPGGMSGRSAAAKPDWRSATR